MRAGRAWLACGAGLGLLALVAAGVLLALNRLDEAPLQAQELATPATPAQIARGEYLVRVGNCLSCHTTQGGPAFAGGRAIDTPFGAIHAPNLTPDNATGIGRWSAGEFWRAMHNGRSRDGRLLYPAFPYLSYTHVTRADSDAIYAYLHSLPPVEQKSRPHQLRFPFNTQLALAVWRAIYFRPGPWVDQPGQSPQWNRGAYLVQGLGHCAACHTPRNALGALRADAPFGGGRLAVQNWYAPALNSVREAGVADWPVSDVVALLKAGVSQQAGVSGPMAEVVFRSLQHLNDDDLQAMAEYLRSLSLREKPVPPVIEPTAAVMAQGREIYRQQCAQCHGDHGQGRAGALPALAGNRAVLLADSTNLVRVVLQGGYLPATAGNPRPHGMPPFMQSLTDAQIAAVLSYIRNAWGNGASRVDTIDVYRARERRGS